MSKENKPNLSMEPCGGRIVRSPSGGNNERYISLRDCSARRNIPYKILTLAKSEAAPGLKSNNFVYWEEFQPWLVDHYERLYELIKDSYGGKYDLREEKLKQEVIALKNKNKKEDKSYINRKLVFSTLLMITNKLQDTLRQKLEYELPIKCAGLSQIEMKSIMTKMVDEILHNFKKPLTELNNNQDITEEDTDEEIEIQP